jgi:4-amino-4-deoxy-L-arabinose transferase-like glycosyltransferase
VYAGPTAGVRGTSSDPTALPGFAAGPVGAIALVSTALLLAFASRYGYHRDELYFLSASRHLDFGYVDQPPIAVLVAWLDRVGFGNTLLGLRAIPAVLSGAVVALTGAMTRELGGSRFAQAFAALCVATGALLVVGHLEGPTVYDVFVWAVTSWLVLRILRTGNERLWLLVGTVVGVGLEAKDTILLLLAGLALGFLIDRRSRIFRSPWLWAGVVVAVVLWAPNIIWQATNGWPTTEMDASLRAEHSGLGYAIKYPFVMVLALGPFVAPVWTSGAWAFWRDRRMASYRAFAVAYAFGFGVLWVVIPDRFYYLFGIYPVLIAAGAPIAEQVAVGARGFFRAEPRRRLLWRSRRWAVGLVLGSGVLLLPVSLPVVPPSALASVPLQKVNYNLGEEIGWQDLTREVARAWRSLPPSERARAVVLTENYGEAGAIDRYGGRLGLPRAYSGHNSFWSWGPPEPSVGTTIAIGFDRSALTPHFGRCALSARVHNADDVDNDEEGQPIWVCTGQRAPWPQIWEHFKHYG